MGAKPKITKKKFKAALSKSGGTVTSMAKLCGVERKTVYRFLKKYPDMKLLLDNESEMISDIAENNIQKLVISGNYKACVFWLQCKARGRGFGKVLTIEDGEVKDNDPLRSRLDKLNRTKSKIKQNQ